MAHFASLIDTAKSADSSIRLSVSYNFKDKQPLFQNVAEPYARGFPSVAWTPHRIAEHLLHGYALCPALLHGDRRTEAAFESAQLILVDLDHGPNVAGCWYLDFVRANAALVYETPSSTPASPRTRIVFVLDRPIADRVQYKEYVRRLMHYLKTLGLDVDPACKSAAQVFFGHKDAVHILRDENRLSLDFLASLPTVTRTKGASKVQRSARSAVHPETPSVVSGEERERLKARVKWALGHIPRQLDYDVWLSILMAVHSTFPDADGVALIEAWSPGYPGEVGAKFDSFDGYAGAQITLATLWYVARQHGWSPLTPPPDIVADRIVNEKYVTTELLPEQGVVVVRSPMGTGKTEVMKQMIARQTALLGRTPKVLSTLHRVSLAGSLCNRLGLENYRSLLGSDVRRAPRLACVINSLWRLISKGLGLPEYDVLLLDEFEQLLAHLCGSTFTGSAGITADNILRSLIRRAQYVLVMDAYISPIAVEYLRSIRDDVYIIDNQCRVDSGSLEVFHSHSALLDTLVERLETASGPIVVVSDQRRDVEAIHQHVSGIVGPDNVVAIHSGNSQTREIQERISSVNTWLTGRTVLVYSPTISSGIDILAEVECVFGIFHGNTITAPDAMQMLGRCRKARDFFVYLGSGEGQRETNRECIYLSHYVALLRTGLECDFSPDGFVEPNPSQKRFLELYAAVTAERNRSLNDFCDDFLRLARRRYAITFSNRQASETVACAVRQAAQGISERFRARVLSSPPVSDDEYRNHVQRLRVTPDVEAGYLRWQIESFYGRQISEDLQREWDEGRGADRLRRFLELHQARGSLRTLDRDEERDRLPAHQRGHHAVTQRVLLDCFAAIFGDTLHCEGLAEKELKERLEGPFQTLTEKHASVIQSILSRRPSQSDDPLVLLRALLRSCGLLLRMTRQGKRRDRVYCLDHDRLEQMRDLAKSRAMHLKVSVKLDEMPLR